MVDVQRNKKKKENGNALLGTELAKMRAEFT